MKKTYIDSQNHDYDKRSWIKLVNSLSGFKSANLVGSVSNDGQTNLAMISSFFHLGANPPLMGFVVRPHSTLSPRHTLMNIMENKSFTVNHIHPEIYKQAHQTSARYERDQSEFDMTGLKTEFKDDFKAPYVAQSHLQIGMSLQDIMDIKLNNTQIIVGKIEKLYVPESAIKKDGFIDIESLGSLCVSSLDSYHKTERLSRLNYAKPDKETYEISLEGDL